MDKSHSRSLVAFIVEAIDEVAPGQGEAVYWRAFERFQECVARERREADAKELQRSMPLEEWTIE